MEGYIHPNFNPTCKDSYLDLVLRLRDVCLKTEDSVIYISPSEYNILEDAAGRGYKHKVYGVEIKKKIE